MVWQPIQFSIANINVVEPRGRKRIQIPTSNKIENLITQLELYLKKAPGLLRMLRSETTPEPEILAKIKIISLIQIFWIKRCYS